MKKERLQELAGIQLNESGLVRTVGAGLADEMIKRATVLVKPAVDREDKQKVQEYVNELMAALHASLKDKGFTVG